MASNIVNKADVVIIGGGITGCSIAYNLARRGCRNVVVVERQYLAAGATGRCGAGVRQQWGTEMNCRLAKASVEFFERMNEELEYTRDVEFKQGGYLILAYTEKQLEQFKKNVALQNSLGIPSKLISPEEARRIVPHLNTEGLLGATFCGTDGHANPFHATQAYADAARRLGVKIYTYTEVTGIKVAGGRVQAVVTDKGEIATPVVVNAAGPYSAVVGRMAGLELPIYPERHQILVTEPVEPMQGPMVISFHHHLYCQQTPHGSFIMGVGDPNEPQSFNIHSSWQFLEEMAKQATWLLPVTRHLRVVRQWAGLYTMTQDRQPILGGHPELEGFYMAIGFSGHGFMIAPMTGQLMAELILGQKLSLPIDRLDVGRFARGELVLEPSVV